MFEKIILFFLGGAVTVYLLEWAITGSSLKILGGGAFRFTGLYCYKS
ncbi:hypothetical protein SFC55_24800 [Niallia taxi]